MSFRQALRAQADNNRALGSPFTARLLCLLADRLSQRGALGERLFGWQGDPGPGGDSLPLRLLGGLNALVLKDLDPGLAAVWPPSPPPAEAALWRAVSGALARHAGFLDRWIDSPPQTNEVRRSAALIAAAHWLARRFPLPLVLSELGASAGLNLNWDRFALRIGRASFGPNPAALTLAPDWSGPPPPAARPRIAARRGCDLNPLDPSCPDDALRLIAYLWPDQPGRLELARAAMALPPAPVDHAEAAGWLERRLAGPRRGRLHLVYHTIAWQYFPAATQKACQEHLDRAGARATPTAPLAHLAMEADGGAGAGLRLRLWPGGEETLLARVDFHGRWVDWRAI